jgi:hypothetical protein
MDIKSKTVLVIGGWGLVGSAVCRKLMEEKPKRIILTSLKESEAKEAVAQMEKEYPETGKSFFIAWWGNIFTRHEFKDINREEILADPAMRTKYMDDILDELSEPVLHRFALYQLLKKFKPDIVIDCVNSATGIAYHDIFQSARSVVKELKASRAGSKNTLHEVTERLICTLYIPQPIRHVQIFYKSMHQVGTSIYVKIGTSGMGLNIPYTHSEEKPSSVLLSKSSVAGAHTLLLFLMGRTPDAPITKEIKPIISIGIPILMPDGKTLLRGNEIKIPAFWGENALPVTAKSINLWAINGWVDLQVSKIEKWKNRFKELMTTIEKLSESETSSRFFRNREYLSNFTISTPGRLSDGSLPRRKKASV